MLSASRVSVYLFFSVVDKIEDVDVDLRIQTCPRRNAHSRLVYQERLIHVYQERLIHVSQRRRQPEANAVAGEKKHVFQFYNRVRIKELQRCTHRK